MLGGTLLAAACATQTPAPSTDTAPIDEIRGKFQTAYNAGDAAGIAALYAEDAVTQPDQRPEIRGRANIEKDLQQTFSQMSFNLQITPGETEIVGDIAHEHGTYTMTITPKAGGAPMPVNGKYLIILRRQADGAWKVIHDMDNTSAEHAPAAAPAAAPAK
jgi:uncharacterized protein (TIGR02246 family)